MSVELTYGLRYRQSTPDIPAGRYFKYKVEGSIEGQFGYRYATDSISFSAGSTGTISPGEATTETTATVSQDVYTACEDAVKVSIETKLGDFVDFMMGHSEKTPEQIMAEMMDINISWQIGRGGMWENVSVSAAIAPLAVFANDATFITLQIQSRFDRTVIERRPSSIIVSGIYSCSVPIAVTPAGVIRIGQLLYSGATRAVNFTVRIGSWISRTFAAGTTGEAVLLGGVVIGGAVAGSAASTAFCMWLIDSAHRSGVARGLTNQMASGFVRYLFDREHVFANLIERGRDPRYQARVHGGTLADNEVRNTSLFVVRDIWKHRLFPERTHITDSYVRSNIGIAIDRMTLILEASGEGYSAE